MMHFSRIVNEVAAPSTLGEKAALAITTLVLGMLTVFAVMIVIMLIISLIGSIFAAKDKKAKKTKEAEKDIVAEEPVQVLESSEETEDEGALIAAITAAVSMCMEEPVGSFRVVSFKKATTKPSWNKK